MSFTLNRPEKCNALNSDISAALVEACGSLGRDTQVVILRGAGKHFCAGADLKELYGANRSQVEQAIQLQIEACQALASLRQTTIAVLHGKCYGGGAFLSLYCDLRIGCRGVEFALPEVPFGWIPPYGLERMKNALPHSFCLDMLLSGRVCDDEEALEKGWLHSLAGDGEEQPEALDQMLRLSQDALVDTVSFMRKKDLEEMREADADALQLFLGHFGTDHAQSKLKGYFEKRRRS